MDIQEEEDINTSPQTESSSQNKPLSLRKQKHPKQISTKNTKISSNGILNGEIILDNEQIEFIHKKRYRLTNCEELIKIDVLLFRNYIELH